MSTDRAKELEEKRKRLAEIKLKREGTKSSPAASTPIKTPSSSTQTPNNLSQINSLDQLMGTLTEVGIESTSPIQTRENPTVTPLKSQLSSTTQTTSSTSEHHPTSKPTLDPSPSKKPRKPLTITSHIGVYDISAEPKAETYDKGTQTRAWEEDKNEILQTPKSPSSSVSSSNFISRREKMKSRSMGRELVHTVEEVRNELQKQEALKPDSKPKVQIKEMGPLEKEKVVQTHEFSNFIENSSKIIERIINLSEEYDIFQNYKSEDSEEKSKKKGGIQVITKLFDEKLSKGRSVQDLDFSVEFPDLVAASFSPTETDSSAPNGLVLVWSIHNALKRPEYVFTTQSTVTSVKFSPFSPTTVIGGTYAGQIVLWDTRAKGTPVQITSLSSKNHTHPIYATQFVGTKNANNLVSVSTDGKLCVWSTEKLVEPIETLQLNFKAPDHPNAPVAVTCLAFPKGEVNEFLVGSEEGCVFSGHRHGTKSGITHKYNGHFGPITGLDLHPILSTPTPTTTSPSLFLTSALDWSLQLWQAGVSAPVRRFETLDYALDVQWNPHLPATFAAADATGMLQVFDLVSNSEVPVARATVSPGVGLNKVRWSKGGKKNRGLGAKTSGGNLMMGEGSAADRVLVAGDAAGALHVCQVAEWEGSSVSPQEQSEKLVSLVEKWKNQSDFF